MITFNEYQEKAHKTAVYPQEKWLEYLTLGLVGEAGEVANKVKKVLRDDGGILSFEKGKDLGKELGDIQWYLSELSYMLGKNLNDVAEDNLIKLESRLERGKIAGSGDNR